MRLIILCLISFSSFAQFDLKLSVLENPFLLPEDVTGFNVRNISRNTEALSLKYILKLKKRKVFKFSIINKINLNALIYNTDLIKNKNEYNLNNRDNVNDKIKDISFSVSSLAYKKIASRTVIFADFEAKYSDGYNLEYDLSLAGSKTYDYYLISKKNINLKLGSGVQTKLTKKVRFNANYRFSISDYFNDYSIYEINKDQEEDNIAHSLSANLNFKLSRFLNLDFKSFNVYKIYKNKLALKENGFVVVQGLARAEKLLDFSGSTALNLKMSKSLKASISSTRLVRQDLVSEARDVIIDSYKFLIEYKRKLILTSSFEYKNFEYKNQIASLVNESDARLRDIDSRNVVLGVSYSGFSFNFTNINTDSTRDYDSINYNKYELGYKITF